MSHLLSIRSAALREQHDTDVHHRSSGRASYTTSDPGRAPQDGSGAQRDTPVDQSSVEDVRQADRADFKQIARSRARAQTLEEALRDEVRKGSGS
jgi:hypothetical protein